MIFIKCASCLPKPYTQATLDQRDRRWVRRVSETLSGKTLGILGLDAHRDEIVAALFVDNVRRFLGAEPLVALVDRARGY